MSGQEPSGAQGGGASLRRENLRVLRDLLAVIDAETTSCYAEHGGGHLRPRFTPAMIALRRTGAMTVRELARHLRLSHSAASQSVTLMRAENLVVTTTGTDARAHVVTLTGRGRELVPFLEGQRRAAEHAGARLDVELVCPLADVVADLQTALGHRSFLHRLRDVDAGHGPRSTQGLSLDPG